MNELLAEPAFAIEQRLFRLHDVVAAARAWGDWARIEQRVRDGIACERRADAGDDPLTQAELDHAAEVFRYARDLFSTDETHDWLRHWHLDIGDWSRWLRRSLLRERWPGEYGGAGHAPDQDTAAESVCSGDLELLVRQLAERAAVCDGLGAHEAGPAEMEERFSAWCEATATEAAIERELSAHRLDWTRVRCLLVETADASVAAEAALCVGQDGRELADVAAEAGLAVSEERMYLDRADPQLAPRLTGAQAGELIGPVAVDGRLVLAFVTAREAPSAEDPDTRTRARRRVVERAVETEILRRVRWHRRP